jgi:hypothetical protein
MMKRLLIGLACLVSSVALASVTVTVNGTNYTIPQTNEKGWGTNVTNWIQAMSANTLQPSGGAFTLTADADFGASFGLKALYLKSETANIAGAGVLRLANADGIGWRNIGNAADLVLKPAADGILNYNGVALLRSGFVVDADIASGAAIARSKIAAGTASHVIINDGSGNLSSEAQLAPTRGGTGVSNAGTLTYGSSNIALTTSGATALTLPTSGTVDTLEGSVTLSGSKQFSAPLVLSQNATPAAAPASSIRLYAKSDNKVYRIDPSGVEKEIGGGAINVNGSRASPVNIVAGTGIDSGTLGTDQRKLLFINGNGGAVIVTANPQIAAGSVVGQELIVIGRSDSNTVTFADGTGLSLNGSITMYADSVLSLIWDGTNWVETSRRF